MFDVCVFLLNLWFDDFCANRRQTEVCHSPDVILCGWLGSKYQLTNWHHVLGVTLWVGQNTKCGGSVGQSTKCGGSVGQNTKCGGSVGQNTKCGGSIQVLCWHCCIQAPATPSLYIVKFLHKFLFKPFLSFYCSMFTRKLFAWQSLKFLSSLWTLSAWPGDCVGWRAVSKLVSRCFKPSRPLRITSGLNTNSISGLLCTQIITRFFLVTPSIKTRPIPEFYG